MNIAISPSKVIYTVCFLTRGDDILLIFRNKPPNRGLWNGVGGHIEKNETPRESCVREIKEETGLVVQEIRFGGILTWSGFEIPEGGLYIYTAPAPGYDVSECKEGRLQWFSREWVYSSPQVVSNIHFFLPVVLRGQAPIEYYFEYENGRIMRHAVNPLPVWLNLTNV